MSTFVPSATTDKTASEEFSELTRRALALYEEKLRSSLEAEKEGHGLAIHPDSGDYIVADTPTKAGHAMRQRHPDGEFVTMRIGATPDYQLAARLQVLQRHERDLC